MSATISRAIPPTNNTLGPEERSRLLRSTRKLGAVLGATPYLLEPEVDNSSASVTTEKPRSRATRREGRIFNHSPSSSISSLSDSMTEPEYVMVSNKVRSAPYQTIHSSSTYSSPSSSRSASPMRDFKKSARSDMSVGAHGAPIAISLHSRTQSGASTKKGKGPQVLAQPLLLRLRSVPVAPVPPMALAPLGLAAAAPEQGRNHIGNGIKVSSKHTVTASTNKPLPLSPVTSTFNISMTVESLDSPTEASFPSPGAMTDREKRRKLAKLQRTLGENIPPELVFGQQPHTAAPGNAQAQQQLPKRRTSLTAGLGLGRSRVSPDSFSAPSHKLSKSSASARLPSLAVSEAPMPAARVSLEQEWEQQKSSSVTATMNALGPTSTETSAPTKKKLRPRSLTLNAALSAETTRGTTSLDVRRPAMPAPAVPPMPLANLPVYPEQPFAAATGAGMDGTEGDGTRRKEREWSGEWNAKDMEEVTKKLRGLKGR